MKTKWPLLKAIKDETLKQQPNEGFIQNLERIKKLKNKKTKRL